jgi:putative component of membrane protein insertase Oxa1/YidC/SpoIIIJ protein YidD
MNPKVSELIERIHQIQEEIEREVQLRRAELHADFEHRRIRFEREVLEQQRRFRAGLLAYIFGAELRHVATAPVIYAVFIPLVLADLFVTAYQYVCFPFYRIPRVKRSEHFFFDRSHLAYLNALEKLNCAYCSYANGLASYMREIVARTEQYWCPIKHARRLLHAHPYHDGFADYGDAEGYRRELRALREALAGLEAEERK